MNNKYLFILVGILVVAGIGFYLYNTQSSSVQQSLQPDNQQMPTPISSVTNKVTQESDKSDLIVVDNLKSDQIISSPLKISGKARGNWYFEASFPIKIFDANNKLIGQAIATAQSDWMTENFVSFTATLEFEKPQTNNGWLIFEKDNPSGLAENDDELRIPVNFY